MNLKPAGLPKTALELLCDERFGKVAYGLVRSGNFRLSDFSSWVEIEGKLGVYSTPCITTLADDTQSVTKSYSAVGLTEKEIVNFFNNFGIEVNLLPVVSHSQRMVKVPTTCCDTVSRIKLESRFRVRGKRIPDFGDEEGPEVIDLPLGSSGGDMVGAPSLHMYRMSQPCVWRIKATFHNPQEVTRFEELDEILGRIQRIVGKDGCLTGHREDDGSYKIYLGSEPAAVKERLLGELLDLRRFGTFMKSDNTFYIEHNPFVGDPGHQLYYARIIPIDKDADAKLKETLARVKELDQALLEIGAMARSAGSNGFIGSGI